MRSEHDPVGRRSLSGAGVTWAAISRDDALHSTRLNRIVEIKVKIDLIVDVNLIDEWQQQRMQRVSRKSKWRRYAVVDRTAATGVGLRAVNTSRDIFRVRVQIVGQSETDLFQIVLALRASRRLSSLLDCW